MTPSNSMQSEPAAKKRKKKALGRGLDALIPQGNLDVTSRADLSAKSYFECEVDLIQPNPFQPRTRFDTEELTHLSESIKKQGILQPLLVRRLNRGYELVAGERRLRAAKLAGLHQVPVVVKDVSDGEMIEMSIVENIQRENLNPIEEADAYQRLITEFGLTQERAAERVGKSRSAVANFLRLRQLPDTIKTSISEGRVSMGHARALLGLTQSAQQNAVWREILKKELSVRQTEALVKRLRNTATPATPKPLTSEERHLAGITEDLSRRFGTKVQIKRRGKKGKLEIEFYNDEDLDRVLNLLKVSD
jgi:ParB family chromosome partitioning protein